ncbi:uncharacterized protein LOC142225916 [Haematobia irritans]|uniref:uncharacterized protein LOC142225916 n=1 Tax=Haematobia irritans TaxID=7368 RepID=UPI003F4FDD53
MEQNEKQVSSDFTSSLLKLTHNNKYIISHITMVALKYVKYAKEILRDFENFLKTINPGLSLSMLYVLDSITKNDLSRTYAQLFSTRIVDIFCGVFLNVDEKTRESMYALRHTWYNIFPENQLYSLDVSIHDLDSNWPITAKKPSKYIQSESDLMKNDKSTEYVEEYLEDSEPTLCSLEIEIMNENFEMDQTNLPPSLWHNGQEHTLLSNTFEASVRDTDPLKTSIVNSSEIDESNGDYSLQFQIDEITQIPMEADFQNHVDKFDMESIGEGNSVAANIARVGSFGNINLPLYNWKRPFCNNKRRIPQKLVASVCMAAHQFLMMAVDFEQCTIVRNPTNSYLAERNHKGRFATCFEDLVRCEDKFKENFHMDVETFFCLFGMVHGRLKHKKMTRPIDGITPKEKLAVTLEYFACGTLQRHIASAYRISKQHFGKIVDEVCSAICEVLIDEIPPMTNFNIQRNADTFIKWNFPNCVGAIDGKHISIKCPKKSGSMFYNYKGFFSIVLLAVSDGDYRFVYFDVGAYGSEGDANIFSKCALGKAIMENRLNFPVHEENSTPYTFVADDAFPLQQRIMKPYKPSKNNALDENKQIFNYRLSRARRCIENAFGIMCSKSYCLSKTMSCGPDRAKSIIKTCAYLHNFLLRTRRDKYCPTNLADRENRRGQVLNGNFRNVISRDSLFFSDILPASRGRVDGSGSAVRERIMEFVNSQEGSVPWQRKKAFLE